MCIARSFRTRRTGSRATVSLLLWIVVFLFMTLSGKGFTAPSPPSPEMELSKGVFLVASRNLVDPRFRKTVVLLTRHSELETVGLIINRPTEVSLTETFPENPSLEQNTDPVYIGGPVDAHRIQLLIRSRSRPEGSHRVLDSVYVSSSRKLLERLGRNGKDDGETFRVFVGYAGWAPGQLESEILRGGWHVMPADAKTLFERNPEDIWSELMRRIAPVHELEARLADPGQCSLRPRIFGSGLARGFRASGFFTSNSVSLSSPALDTTSVYLPGVT